MLRLELIPGLPNFITLPPLGNGRCRDTANLSVLAPPEEPTSAGAGGETIQKFPKIFEWVWGLSPNFFGTREQNRCERMENFSTTI